MKVLFINAPFIDGIVADMSDYFDGPSGAYPPVGIMYMAAYLRENGYPEVQILDANVPMLSYEQIRERVRQIQPDVVGITTMTFNLISVLKIAEEIKAILPKTIIALGGPHVTIFPRETLAFPFVDYVVTGEGELVFHKILQRIEKGMGVEDLRQVGYKKDGKLVMNPAGELLSDLDALPFPALDLIDYKRYYTAISPGHNTTVMITSRGCPFKCIYCDRPALGKLFRAHSPKRVVDEMEHYVTNFGINDFKLFDDTFTVDRNRIIGICEEIKRRKLKVSWGMRARVNTVTDQLVETMADAGLTSVSFGIESGNEEVLKTLTKGIRKHQISAAVDACRKHGVEVLGDFILGNPGEKEEQIKETVDLACSLGLDYAQFTIMTPYPATQLYTMGLQKGIIPFDHWQRYAANPTKDFVTPVWTENYTKEQLVDYLRMAYRSFYFRPAYVWHRVSKLRSFNEFSKKLQVFFSLVKLNLLSKDKLTGNFQSAASRA